MIKVKVDWIDHFLSENKHVSDATTRNNLGQLGQSVSLLYLIHDYITASMGAETR